MKQFTFHVTGASPYDGEISIIAKTIKTAKRMAHDIVNDYNAATSFSQIELVCDVAGRIPFNPPCVVHFESGEA